MIQKVDEFGGIEKLTKDLKRFRTFASEKKWFDNMIIYFNTLYTDVVDVEAYAMEYHQASLDTIAYLKEFTKTRNEETITFLIDLITFKLNHISGVRRIS